MRIGGRGNEQKGKRTHGNGQQWWFPRGGHIRGVNGNGKNIIKIKKEKNKLIKDNTPRV